MCSSLGDGENIAIVDWTLADSTSLSFPRRLIWRRRARVSSHYLFRLRTGLNRYKSQWLALLPDDRLICDDGFEIMLFDLSVAPVSTLLPTQQNQPPAQGALARLKLIVDAISPPYLVHDSIRFSILTSEGVKGLIVPHTRSVSRAMSCIDLLSRPNVSNSSHVGLNVGYVGEPIVLQYSWPGEHSSFIVSQESSIRLPYCPKLLFDDYSSRLVTLGVGSTIEYILDLAAI